MDYMRKYYWAMIAHEHVRVKLNLFTSQIRRDIHFGMVQPLVAFKESQPSPVALFQPQFLDAASVPPADELPPLSLCNTLTDLGEKWTAAVYKIYCDVWSEQGQSKCESFVLDVWYEGVVPWIRDELPSLLCCALSWAMPALRIATMRNNVPVKYQLDYCKGEAKLAGIARTCKSILDRWPYTKIYEERGHTRIPPVDAFTVQMEESQKMINEARTMLANANSGRAEPQSTQMAKVFSEVSGHGSHAPASMPVIAPQPTKAMRKPPEGLTFVTRGEDTIAETCNNTVSQVAYTMMLATKELHEFRAYVSSHDDVTPDKLREVFSSTYLITSGGADRSDLKVWTEIFRKGKARATANGAALAWCGKKTGLERDTIKTYVSRHRNGKGRKN